MATKVISGSYPNGYSLDPSFSSLTITSTATVSGPGVTTTAAQPSMISNAGRVSGSQTGISFSGGGSLTNAGANASVQGVTAVTGSGGATSIVNRANIASTGVDTENRTDAQNFTSYTTTGTSIVLSNGGSVDNATTAATIANGISIAGARASVSNLGTIGSSSTYKAVTQDGSLESTTSDEGAAIQLQQGGSITNTGAGAKVMGGIAISGGSGTVTNSGVLQGSESADTDFRGGYFRSTGTAVTLSNGGRVSNEAGGTITGVSVAGAAATIVNDGQISGATLTSGYQGAYGDYFNFQSNTQRLSITLSTGGTVSNGSATNTAATVTQGISIAGGAGRVINFGTIGSIDNTYTSFSQLVESQTAAITMSAGGTVTNATSGTINGVSISGGSARLDNQGKISGPIYSYYDFNTGTSVATTDYSALFASTATVANGSTANAAAALTNGIKLGAGGRITNFGAIGSNSAGVAVAFTQVGTTLVQEGTGSITGTVIGGGGTLILANDAGAGTIGGIGSTVTGFVSIQVEPNAHWTITGPTTISASTTFETAGTASFTGRVENHGTILDKKVLDRGSSGQILNATDGTLVFVGNSSVTEAGTTSGFGLLNYGLIKRSGVGTTTIGAITNLANSGKVAIESGSLRFASRNTTIAGAVSGAGSIVFGPGRATLAAGASITTAGLRISGGGAQLIVNTTLSYGGTFTATTGTELTVNANTIFTLAGQSAVSGATIDGNGRLTLRGASAISAVTLGGKAVLANYGTVTEALTTTLGSETRLVNSTSATFTLAGNGGIAGGGRITNAGLLVKTAGTGRSILGGAVTNTGSIEARAGTIAFTAAVSGSGGVLKLAAGTSLEFGTAVARGQTVSFGTAGGDLLLKDARSFAATIDSFETGDTIDLRGFRVAGETLTYAEKADGTGGTLTLKSGSNTAALKFNGDFDAAGFHISTDSGGGTNLTYSAPQAAAASRMAAADSSFAHSLFEAAFGGGTNGAFDAVQSSMPMSPAIFTAAQAHTLSPGDIATGH